MDRQKVIISNDLQKALSDAIAECPHDKLFVLVDETTHQLCLPVIAGFDCMQEAQCIDFLLTCRNDTVATVATLRVTSVT